MSTTNTQTLEQLIEAVQEAAYAGLVRIAFNGDTWRVEWYEQMNDLDGGVDWYRWLSSDQDHYSLRRQLEATLHFIRTEVDDWDGDA